jgi:hypothetical protein
MDLSLRRLRASKVRFSTVTGKTSMIHNRSRSLRLLVNETFGHYPQVLSAAARAGDAARGNPRFIGQVVDGGSMPRATGRVFLVNPVTLSGLENEAAPTVLSVDGTRKIPVVVIGARPPAAGDLLLALALGGRWVAEVGGTATLPCSPCPIPSKDLTLSWANNLIGTGSTKLTFIPPSQWTSACANQLLFQLTCAGNVVQLTVTYYISGVCPGGQGQSCTSPGSNPLAITLDSFSCSPFLLDYSVNSAGCPVLWSDGYTAFTITE